MPALDYMIENNIRLIDYEKISDQNGSRLVAFGRFAGIAGAIDFLAGLGIFIFKKGIFTPLINISPAYKYFNLN